MNHNIDRKQIALFRKLARKSSSAIKEIRRMYLENMLDCIDFEDYCGSEKEKKLRKEVKKMSIGALLTYWVDCYDADAYVLPKRVVKQLSEAEKFTLDIEGIF